MPNNNRVLIRGGGDLASGIAIRLHRTGIRMVITELEQPLAVRRAVSFSEAVYEGSHVVEGVKATLIVANQLAAWHEPEIIPVLVDPDASIMNQIPFPAVIDARLRKDEPTPLPVAVPLHIGVGPGFHAGRNCHAVIETRRSHTLGRVFWTGAAQPDSGLPEGDPRRVLRASQSGRVKGMKKIGDFISEGEAVAVIDGRIPVETEIRGVLRGLIRDGIQATQGMKIGDVDARNDPAACFLVSDKALAIGGGVLEALASLPEIRRSIWD